MNMGIAPVFVQGNSRIFIGVITIMPTIIVLGTLDTKGIEYRYICDVLETLQLDPVVVDISCFDNAHQYAADYSCNKLAELSGADYKQIREKDRKGAAELILKGAKTAVSEIYSGAADGIIALGGANGTFMACEVMKTLPLGFPKVMISVVPAGDPRENVGTDDIVLFNTITDTYLNAILKTVINNACAGLLGMIEHSGYLSGAVDENRESVCISMLGLVQKCLDNMRYKLEDNNWELQVFHANGMGGRAMEKIISTRQVDGVIELAINELLNNIVGGVFDAGENRMDAAIRGGKPMVIVPGCIDFINFWGQNIPEKYKDRTFIYHTAQNTLMRTNVEESAGLGEILAEKLSRVETGTAVLIPDRGVSGNDAADGSMGINQGQKVKWYDPEANKAFSNSLESNITNDLVKIEVLDSHINDKTFALEVLKEFSSLTEGRIDGECATDKSG